MATEFTLLIVDDNQVNRDVLGRRFANKGYSVLYAEDGPAAIITAVREPVDLVVLDVMMPGMSGIEVLRALRENSATRDVPVMMATAMSESAAVVEALELGANDYVTKPIDFPVVLARVQAQLRGRAPRAQRKSGSVKTGDGITASGELGPGRMLTDKYRLDKLIGQGGYGVVYHGTHVTLERPVAIKVLRSSTTMGSDAIERFRREGISTGRLRHPNIVQVLDAGTTEAGANYMVMELLDGAPLDAEMRRQGKLSIENAAAITLAVADALAFAHEAGVVHRDIKPSNIFLQRAPTGVVPKVLDFGLAKLTTEILSEQRLTADGTVLGTIDYVAPERLSGNAYDGKVDVYSLAISFFEMLTGRLLFDPQTAEPLAVLMMHLTKDPPPLRSFLPEAPEALEAAILGALVKEPKKRSSIEEFADAIKSAVPVVGSAQMELGGHLEQRGDPFDEQQAFEARSRTVPGYRLPDSNAAVMSNRKDTKRH